MAETVADTRRLITKPQNLNDAYGPPSNFLEIDVSNPQTVGVGRGRFTTYEIRVKTNLPIFKLKESTVRRRYSDFEWLRSELERESKMTQLKPSLMFSGLPHLPVSPPSSLPMQSFFSSIYLVCPCEAERGVCVHQGLALSRV
ncbi:sorting nexin-3 isoform X3 [Erinaceus europaeus]|uniref:Sorting nexin-3 isoform X3 n=1 Tax=Erinaceus europaeus TaxID=9365 RepID=A0ABM3XCW7_ERIEU|nr:sorting nexin-3 isoform X3 [Erinaceus europaeus]